MEDVFFFVPFSQILLDQALPIKASVKCCVCFCVCVRMLCLCACAQVCVCACVCVNKFNQPPFYYIRWRCRELLCNTVFDILYSYFLTNTGCCLFLLFFFVRKKQRPIFSKMMWPFILVSNFCEVGLLYITIIWGPLIGRPIYSGMVKYGNLI